MDMIVTEQKVGPSIRKGPTGGANQEIIATIPIEIADIGQTYANLVRLGAKETKALARCQVGQIQRAWLFPNHRERRPFH